MTLCKALAACGVVPFRSYTYYQILAQRYHLLAQLRQILFGDNRPHKFELAWLNN